MRRAAAAAAALLAAGAVLAAGAGPDRSPRTYAEVRLRPDLSILRTRDREALGHLARAVAVMDGLHRLQMGRPAGGDGARPPGAAFYPGDMTREEFEARLDTHPELRLEFEKPNTLIRRVDGRLVAIPYESMFLDELKTASAALADAARTVDHAALRRYLSLRSTALLSGDYYASDLAWLDLEDHAIDVVIGPIQTHDDRLLGLKASYQGAALVKDPRATRSLEVFRRHLTGMAASLPVDPRLRAVTEGEGGALEVMNVVRFAGDFNAGIKPVAASLPVDERVVQKAGAKKQIYRNVLEAKFDVILVPMARLLLRRDDQALLTREALLTNVLLHELAHGVGPASVTGSGGRSVRRALRDLHAPIAEARADAIAVHALAYLREQEIFTKEEVEECHATYLAGLLRAVRSGTAAPHGRAAALQLNVLLREGGVEHDAKKGGFSVHPRKFEPAIAGLAALLLEIEGRGDAAGAAALLDGMGDPDPATAAALAAVNGVPVDVTFDYPL